MTPHFILAVNPTNNLTSTDQDSLPHSAGLQMRRILIPANPHSGIQSGYSG